MTKKKVFGLVAVLTVILVFLSGSDEKSPCACGSVNDEVILILNGLDNTIKQYANAHDGKHPSYEEFRTLASNSLRKERLGLLKFSNDVDVQAKNFTFKTNKKHTFTIGYATSPNAESYVLIGVGKSEKRLFLISKQNTFLRYYTYPTLYPHQKPVDHSPAI